LALILGIGGLGELAYGASAQGKPSKYLTEFLEVEASWRLQSPTGRFDASGIERGPAGQLLVVRDSELAVYAVKFQENSDIATLVKHARYGVAAEDLDVGSSRFDIEGLALDSSGILYTCDEFKRRVLRFSSQGQLDSIPINLDATTKFFSKTDFNASFEGIAIGDGSLYLANERSQGRLIELDLKTGELLSSFVCKTGTSFWPDTHYSGLDWHKGKLFALLREEQAIIEIDPKGKTVERIFRYHGIEFDKQHRYRTLVPFAGVMEGLLIEDDVFWLLTDNNGQARLADKTDSRPTLFKCRIKIVD
jgi:uncharacterized protein YjiK